MNIRLFRPLPSLGTTDLGQYCQLTVSGSPGLFTKLHSHHLCCHIAITYRLCLGTRQARSTTASVLAIARCKTSPMTKLRGRQSKPFSLVVCQDSRLPEVWFAFNLCQVNSQHALKYLLYKIEEIHLSLRSVREAPPSWNIYLSVSLISQSCVSVNPSFHTELPL